MSKVVVFIFICFSFSLSAQPLIDEEGAFIRSDTTKRKIYLCFAGHDFIDGFDHVLDVLNNENIHASFFLTGDFIRNHTTLVKRINTNGHYVGAHSDKHLLYCDWSNRDSLLHSRTVIKEDISNNLVELNRLNIYPKYFMPPFEWYNKEIVNIALELNQVKINFSPGTRSNADYTTPDMPNYIPSNDILESIYNYEKENDMNGFHLLIHPGVSARRSDKLYQHLNEIIATMLERNYKFSKF